MSAFALRLASAVLALGLIAAAFFGGDALGGVAGFDWSQALLLATGLGLAACCAAPPHWNARALALVASTGLTLLLAECALTPFLAPRYRPPFEPDPELLYRLAPGARGEFQRASANGGQRIRYRVNRDGFRGEELLPTGTATRVVVYGDSFIQSTFSRREDSFAGRLEHHLAERSRAPIEVVNAGVAGYGPDQVLRRMERELAVLQPDLVVVSIFAGNDYGDLIRNKLYRVGPDGELRDNDFTVDPPTARRLRTARREPLLRRVLREAAQRLRGGRAGFDPSPAARRARMESFLEQNQREYEEHVVQGDDVVRELLSDPYNADLSLLPESDSARYKRTLMDQVVGAIARLADELSIPLLLVLIPHPVDVTSHDSAEVDPERFPAYAPRAPTDALERSAAQRGIPVVNLFEPFRRHAGDSLYFRGGDDHWTDHGQDVAAQLVAERVSALLVASRGDRPVTQPPPVSSAREATPTGDRSPR
ncbi:MAG: GDSL-type esterase/lipase family protein [Myxococcota bacterium]|nr:GDSL-type esterase/lipase family protein [Myxococcota bacterium]